MEAPRPNPPPDPSLPSSTAGSESRGPRRGHRRRRRRTDRTPPAHAYCDAASGAILLFLVVFTPWAFGTTQPWSIWTANFLGYALGGLLLAKHVIRRREEFQPPQWNTPDDRESAANAEGEAGSGTLSRPDWLTRLLAALTVILLGYMAVSAGNALSDYDTRQRLFLPLDEPLRWLPFSVDRSATLAWLARVLALACVFWSARDWLLYRGRGDGRETDAPRWSDTNSQLVFPKRLRWLLWVLCVNGAVLATVAVIHRASGTNHLLWLLDAPPEKPAEMMFGPWPYRGNAAQYFNLLWPVCLAFWVWMQERARRARQIRAGRLDGPQILLLPFAIAIAACPMISGTRGGAVVSAILGLLALPVLMLVSRREVSAGVRLTTVGALVLAGLAASLGGWSTIRERFSRPDMRVATGIEIGTNDFTLLARLKLPAAGFGRWEKLLSVVSHQRLSQHPYSLFLAASPDKHLLAQFVGSSVTNWNHVLTSNAVPVFGEKDALVAFVRHAGGEVHLYVDGREYPLAPGQVGNAPGWGAALSGRYLVAFDPGVTEVGLANLALTAEEIAQLPDNLGTYARQLLEHRPFAELALANTNALVAPPGTHVSLNTRALDPSVQWLALRRSEGIGPLGFSRRLDDLAAPLRGPLRVSLTAWNPAPEPVHLSLSVDGGPRTVVQVPARSEQAVSVSCRPAHQRRLTQVDVFLCDEDEMLEQAALPGTQVLLRDIHLQPDAAFFARPLEHGFRLVNLGDRMSGRNEVYENARQMLAHYPVWGSGPGSFSSLYSMYMQPGQTWAAYLHNDWLETRITFGAVGLGIVVAALATLFLRSCRGSGLPVMRVILALWWAALGGCLVHARFDFPFQIYSVAFLFVLLAAALTVLTAARSR